MRRGSGAFRPQEEICVLRAAVAAGRSHSALGAYYRRLSARLGKAKAVRATAHKLARLIYTLMTQGEAYVDQGQDYYEQQHQQRVVKNIKKKALALVFSIKTIDPVV